MEPSQKVIDELAQPMAYGARSFDLSTDDLQSRRGMPEGFWRAVKQYLSAPIRPGHFWREFKNQIMENKALQSYYFDSFFTDRPLGVPVWEGEFYTLDDVDQLLSAGQEQKDFLSSVCSKN
jgi:hypothetical protein